ncbi:hypothetical protein AB0I81_22520 [Nonomuraea sp. NPDC050404]|uniref:hypothetical protein n=1 Tax=Nonomuraea sp. NPDC050404 TaxID=3155783 RepID=UPI0033DC44D6
MTRHVIIDLDGELHVAIGDWKARFRPHAPGRVTIPTLGALGEWAGWINDDSHPLGLPRNPIGGLVLTGLGANVIPYAGPIVITGWNPHGPTEVCDLTEAQIATIADCHTDARAAMNGEEGALYDRGRAVAEQMRTAPTPTVQLLTGEELLARMRGRS